MARQTSPPGAPPTLRARQAPVSVRIAERIVEAIRSGEYPVNSRLESEHALAERFGASRPSIREALSALQFAGYVQSVRGSGTIVVASTPLTADRARGASGPAHSQDVLDLLEARLILEPRVVALASFDPDPLALKVANQLIDGMRLAISESRSLLAETDLHIHRALVETCRNQFLVEECKRLLSTAADPFWQRARTDAWAHPALLEQWVVQHERVCGAIAAGRPRDAERASRDHLLSVATNALADGSASPLERARITSIVERFGSILSSGTAASTVND